MKRPTSILLSNIVTSREVLLSVVLGTVIFILVCRSVISIDNIDQSTTFSATESSSKQQQQQQQQQHSDELLPWQSCSIFLAPTPTMNWGVYASRNFERGEIVQIAPLTVPLPEASPQVEDSVLWDYVYAYWRLMMMPPHSKKMSSGSRINGDKNNNNNNNRVPDIVRMYSVMLGMDMFFNHHPDDVNIKYTTFGREPDPAHGVPETAINIQGFVAKRRIQAGEELFSTYNGQDDGGKSWFGNRGIDMKAPSIVATAIGNEEQLRQYKQEYCSKIYAGVGLPSWRDRLMPLFPPGRSLPFWIDLQWLAPFDAGLGDAKAKVDIQKGERIELATALVMSLQQLKGSPIRPLVLAWDDLKPEHQEALKTLRQNHQLLVQYQGLDTEWKSQDGFHSFEDLALFPVAGNIGLVRRLPPRQPDDQIQTTTVGEDDTIVGNNRSTIGRDGSNCRLVIHSDMNIDATGVGVTIELVATHDIAHGHDLVLNVPATYASPKEYRMLAREMKLTGQPYSLPYLANVMMTVKQIWQQEKSKTAGEEL